MPGVLIIVIPLAGVIAAPFLRHAFEMRKEAKYREMVGSLFWGILPFGIAALIFSATGDKAVILQNWLLGAIGAAIGATAFVYGGYVVRDKLSAQAQTVSDKVAQVLPGTSANEVVGTTIQGDGRGGTGADVSVTGSPNQATPPVGMDVTAIGRPDQSVTGMRIIQNGPGTGMRVTVGSDGPATGVRVTVGTKPDKSE
jgi:hypothetical protein